MQSKIFESQLPINRSKVELRQSTSCIKEGEFNSCKYARPIDHVICSNQLECADCNYHFCNTCLDVANDDNKSFSDVFSLTNHGFDQQIIKELHAALNELRTDLESRHGDAPRAINVSEQTVQSIKPFSTDDWSFNVIHKVAA